MSVLALLAAAGGAAMLLAGFQGRSDTDAMLRRQLIAASIETYQGNCPCPYSTMRNGRACGGRSAWSRPGGESPLCFDADVSQARLALARRQNERDVAELERVRGR